MRIDQDALVFFLTLASIQFYHQRVRIRRRIDVRLLGKSRNIDTLDSPENWPPLTSLDRGREHEYLSAIERGLSPERENEQITNMRRNMIQAGFFSDHAVFWFYVVRVLLAFILPFTLIACLEYFGSQIASNTMATWAAVALAIGYLAPERFISHQKRELRKQCRNGFPDFMDLMIVCADAGLSPRAGIERVSRGISTSYPFLAANLYLMSLELNAGRSLVDAINSLARRVQIGEIASLGSLLQQTEDLGTSLTEALRVFSEEMRDKRVSLAEEKANELPVKLVLPLGLFVFPVMLIVVVLPVYMRIQEAFQ